VNFVGIVENPHWQDESWRTLGDKRELVDEFADWHPSLATLIDNADDCYKWALHDRDAMPVWSVGRTTLLGDACHPMLPYMAQGAAAAIEDAWVLSRMLENYEEAVDEAFTEYEKYRKPRTTKIQMGSRAQGRQFHLDDGWSIFKRNLRLGFGTRFLPEIAMQQLDWIHGYDCVRGFD
jgi:salicylate hydroxylase